MINCYNMLVIIYMILCQLPLAKSMTPCQAGAAEGDEPGMWGAWR